jgi:hypothetical protein
MTFEADTGYRWRLLTLALVGTVYWLCLQFVFGGRFEPWIPSSDDFYLFFTRGTLFLPEVLKHPRFVAFGVVNVFNKFGFTATAVGIVVLALVTLAIVVWTAAKVMGAAPAWTTITVYLVAILGNPHYFEAHVFDFYHTIGLFFFAVLVFMWYGAAAAPPPSRRLPLLFLLVLLAVGSKETIVPCLFLFFGFHGLFGARETRPLARLLLAWSAILVVALLVQGAVVARYSWVRLDLGRGTPYRIGVETFFPTLVRYLRDFAPWPTLGLVFLAMLLQRDLKTGLLFLALGLGPYVPMSLLPDHVYDFYGWMGLPFGYAPLLLLDKQKLAAPIALRSGRLALPVGRALNVAAAILLALDVRSGRSAVTHNAMVANADYHRNILASFDTVRKHLDGSNHLLVLGLRQTHPFTPKGSRFLARNLLSSGGRITVATYGDPMDHAPPLFETERASDAVDWRDHAAALQDRSLYDGFVTYAADGTLIDVVTSEDLADLMAVALRPGAGPSEIESVLLDGRGVARRFRRATRRYEPLACPEGACVLTSPGVTVRATASGLGVHAPDDDPQLLLPEIPYDKNESCLVRVDLTVPAATVLQLFYQREGEPSPAYTENRSIVTPLFAGRNVRILEIPAPGLVGRLRLDPGGLRGDYVLHGVELRQD